jgi:aryl-alcohol dehydrogenase-like predicted oxidoreductase
MRYRPLGSSGTAISVISLRVPGHRCDGDAQDWVSAIHAAFECGINSFEVREPTVALLQGLGEAVKAVERRLVFVNLRLTPGSTAADIHRQVDEVLQHTDLAHVDLVTLDADAETHTEAVWALEELRASPKVRMIGVAGDTEAVVPHIAGGVFDVLTAPFNILSGWRERLRVRTAVENAMAVIASGHYPEEARNLAEPVEVKKGWFAKPQEIFADIGTYAFLDDTPGWTAEEICLAFALTEPAVASMSLEAADLDHLIALAEVTERELPSAVAAQIEMARFSVERQTGVERRRERRTA